MLNQSPEDHFFLSPRHPKGKLYGDFRYLIQMVITSCAFNPQLMVGHLGAISFGNPYFDIDIPHNIAPLTRITRGCLLVQTITEKDLQLK